MVLSKILKVWSAFCQFLLLIMFNIALGSAGIDTVDDP
jgi:hypothetical protein